MKFYDNQDLVSRLIENERESKAINQEKKFGWTDYYTLDEVRT